MHKTSETSQLNSILNLRDVGYNTQQNHKVLLEDCEGETKAFGVDGLRGPNGLFAGENNEKNKNILRLTDWSYCFGKSNSVMTYKMAG